MAGDSSVNQEASSGKFTRREFLKRAAILTGGVVAGVGAQALFGHPSGDVTHFSEKVTELDKEKRGQLLGRMRKAGLAVSETEAPDAQAYHLQISGVTGLETTAELGVLPATDDTNWNRVMVEENRPDGSTATAELVPYRSPVMSGGQVTISWIMRGTPLTEAEQGQFGKEALPGIANGQTVFSLDCRSQNGRLSPLGLSYHLPASAYQPLTGRVSESESLRPAQIGLGASSIPTSHFMPRT